ncbi:O-antigen ligase family protein [Ignavibacterium sp.]|uniref:O-antigen ligase family protein n=1 Tax=Ignavibacterium sp. TaxID=2651167 RepID=UPI00307DEE5A
MYRIRIPYSELLIKIAFLIFFLFTLLPTGEPFPPTRQDLGVENISESNVTNQLIKLTVFILTITASIYKLEEIISFVKKEKYLFLLIVWSFSSVFWSDFPIVTFKRWFQIFLIYFLVITFLTYYDEKNLLKILKYILYPYLLLTLMVVLSVPEAKDPAFNTWRGFNGTKNTLGQIGVILSVLTLIIYINEFNRVKKNIAVIFFLLSIIIVIGTFSSTSYIALFIFLSGTSLYWFKIKVFGRLGVHNSLLVYTFTSGLLILIIVMIFVPEFTNLIQSIFGKSETFYDRGKLWAVMLWHITEHPIIGCGFQAFWTLENPKLLLLYQTFVWLPNQAHNGYLDVLNEIGVIGLVLFLIMVFKNIFRSFKYQRLTLWLWLLILPLISNVTESNFFRVGVVPPSFIILSYLVLEKSLNSLRKEAI